MEDYFQNNDNDQKKINDYINEKKKHCKQAQSTLPLQLKYQNNDNDPKKFNDFVNQMIKNRKQPPSTFPSQLKYQNQIQDQLPLIKQENLNINENDHKIEGAVKVPKKEIFIRELNNYLDYKLSAQLEKKDIRSLTPKHDPLQNKENLNSMPFHNENSQKNLQPKFEKKIIKITPQPIRIDPLKIKNQHKLMIGGIDIYFPYEPYPAQKQYMEGVMQALENQENGLLQAPTGSGKTLCILCASLGWLYQQRQKQIENKDKKPIRIFYSSRTQTQLKQVVSELKKTVYVPRVTILGSRDQYCIDKSLQFLKGQVLNKECKKKVQEKNCSFYSEFDKNKNQLSKDFIANPEKIQLNNQFSYDNPSQLQDIEELKETGKTQKFCPYFYQKEMEKHSDICFLPYQYLVSITRPGQLINIDNAIIIFDEGHNILRNCEDGCSFEIDTQILKEAEKEIKDNRLLLDNILTNMTVDQMLGPIQALRTFFFDELKKNKEGTQKISEVSKRPEELFTIIEKNSMSKLPNDTNFNLNSTNISTYYNNLCIILQILKNDKEWGTDNLEWGTDNLINFIRGLEELWINYNIQKKKEQDNSYKTLIKHFILFQTIDSSNEVNSYTLKLQCLDPSIAFKCLQSQNPYNFLITSGTLLPFYRWGVESRTLFAVQVETSHVVDVKQNIISGILLEGPHKVPLNFKFNNDEQIKKEIYLDFGRALLNIIKFIPNGVLIVFRSYAMLSECQYQWNNSSEKLIKEIFKLKQIIVEPKGNSAQLMETYKNLANTQEGAILMCVNRGKMSEGIDFTDKLCRAVFIVGVPFLPYDDKKVEAKRNYLNWMGKQYNQDPCGLQFLQPMEFSDWYMLQSFMPANQAIGRVIRHKNDYGAIILVDSRFKQNIGRISKWIAGDKYENIKIWDDFTQVESDIKQFFINKKKNQFNEYKEKFNKCNKIDLCYEENEIEQE